MEQKNRQGLLDLHAHLACLSGAYANMLLRQYGDGAGAAELTKEQQLCLALQELELRRSGGITTCFSCGTMEEWRYLQQFRDREELLISFGIHPWYADRYQPGDVQEAYEACDLIGEIGMDSVWCQVPLACQEAVFREQLAASARLKKPVLLHTKGQERRIAELLRECLQPVCVHWYSGDLETFEQYREMGCYFTLGPDFAQVLTDGGPGPEQQEKKPLYRRMLETLPLDRIFLETDGISAVAWARDTEVLPLSEIPAVLQENLCFLSRETGKTEEELQERFRTNLERFLGK